MEPRSNVLKLSLGFGVERLTLEEVAPFQGRKVTGAQGGRTLAQGVAAQESGLG